MTCAALETIAAWVQGELPAADAEAFEEHLFGCGACTDNTLRLRRLIDQLSVSLPPVLTHARRQALQAGRPRLPTVDVEPGQRRRLHLDETQPIGLWIMHAPLRGATRVDLEARARGALLFYLADVPFDAARGEVVLACQSHYSALPPLLEVTLKAVDPDSERPVSEYLLDHAFESA